MVHASEILAAYIVVAGILGALAYLYVVRPRTKKGSESPAPETSPPWATPSETARAGEAIRIGPEPEEISLERLRLKVWRSRRRNVKFLGRIYLIGGVLSLVAGYLLHYLGFELIAALLIPLGVFFAFQGNEPYVKTSAAGKSVISTMRVLQEALKISSDEGHAIFIPDENGGTSVKMFIPRDDLPDGIVKDNPTQGHNYTPLGHDLFLAYLREAGKPTNKSLSALMDQLKTIMTSALDLVEDISFDVTGPEVVVNIKNPTFAEIGRFPEIAQNVYEKAGDPITNSIAEWICYGTGSSLKWAEAGVDPIARTASVRLVLIPN